MSAKKRKKKKKKPAKRNSVFLSAKMRSGAGPMKHKNTPKKGSKNKQQIYKDEQH